MKTYFWLPFCCLLGLLIGSWGSKEEVLKLHREVDLLERCPKGKPVAGFNALAQMAHIPEVTSKRRPSKKKDVVSIKTGANSNSVNQANEDIQNGDTISVKITEDGATIHSTDLRARIEEAKELWKVRMDIARANAIAELELEEDGKVEAFDNVIADMNEKLYNVVEEIALGLQNQETMTPELAMKLMAVMGDTMADTYDRIGEVVPPEKRDAVSKMQLPDFIDPIVAEPLIGVQDKLSARP